MVLFFASCESGSENSADAGAFGKLKVLVVSFSGDDLNSVVDPWSASMPNFDFSTHLGSTSLTPTQLDSFDVVLLFTNSINNQDALGDTLYQYVTSGGKLLLGTFFAQQTTAKNFGDLSMITPLYHNGNAYSQDTLVNTGSHPLLSGIDSLVTYYSAGSDSLENNAVAVGEWNNGDVYAAYNEHNGGRILHVTMFPAELRYRADLRNATSNNLEKFYRAWSNAIRYVHSKKVSSDDLNYVEEPDNDDDVVARQTDNLATDRR